MEVGLKGSAKGEKNKQSTKGTLPQKTTKHNYEEMGKKPTPGSSAKKIKLELGRSEDATAVAGGESQNIDLPNIFQQGLESEEGQGHQGLLGIAASINAKQAKPSEGAKVAEVAK
ncbi:hypothetical protein M422DRAFT_55446 [Sphaerobolus stellatus SS14]|uniref:Uncharacterized protein n=1 Tax=Sphaerobolus stellatus (strain SS14) TaxID=990650 RepID=A0A0C9UBX5_SPHS4|nr:hypothetical protein M422DRAFT_55446 [Sphaerobolus stellatus SS14]